MSDEKKIEEMARDLCEIQYKGMTCNVCDTGCDCRMLAEALHNEGYRKQSDEEREAIIEKIIRKKAEVSDYWQNDVRSYRSIQGYSDIEHDVDNFLRGYNEAVDDVLAILNGWMKGDKEDGC
jgi:hypothetical protein